MIVPSIDLMGGRAVQLRRGKKLEIDAGDPRPLAEQFGMVGEVAVIDLDAALGQGDNTELIKELLELAPCRVGGGIRSRDAALGWLDAGARRVILGTAATPRILSALPADRVIAALDEKAGEVVVEGWREGTGRGVSERMTELRNLVGGFLVTFVDVEGTLGGLPQERVADLVRDAGTARVTVAGGVRQATEVGALDRLGADVQVGMALYSGRISLAGAVAATLKSDRPDGLWPTVIQDVSGGALGLAWSNLESLDVALRERRGVYHSRSRGLWRKGETSGAVQELVSVGVDCDRDTLSFLVRQAGSGFCHTGTPTCFDSSTTPPRFGVAELEARLRERVDTGNSESLTQRLLADPSFLQEKLLEEAQELAAAESKAEAVAEFADLQYFALTRLLAAGGSLEDVEAELARRSLKIRRREPRRRAVDSPGKGDLSRTRPSNSLLFPDLTLEKAIRATRRRGIDSETMAVATRIVTDIENRGEPALREHAEAFGDVSPGGPLLLPREELGASAGALDPETLELLRRTRDRIRGFAEEQAQSCKEAGLLVAGGWAGDRMLPVDSAGCYAPGGLYPLPSSVLMTVVPARVAGVKTIWVASPRPAQVTRAAAWVAGADGLLTVGGAQAIAALAFGVGMPPANLIVGPGNRFVSAAKAFLYGRVGLDTVAGPSELLIVASLDAEPRLVAADLLAQAEHAPDAVPLLCALSPDTVEHVRTELERQLEDLPTAGVASESLAGGGALVASDLDEAGRIADAIAPEHLHLHGRSAEELADRVTRYGSLFVGSRTPEAAGDYGAGPNHTLPTSGTAAFGSGLSVFTFLRRPTSLTLNATHAGYDDLLRDAARLARLEGLEAHARSAEIRLTD